MKDKLFKKKPKRTTFGKMFAKAMILPVALTLLFAAVLNILIEIMICEQVHQQQETSSSNLIHSIQFSEDKTGKFGSHENLVNFKMDFSTFYDVFFPWIALPLTGHSTMMSDKNGIAAAALIDSDGNVIASNSLRLWCVVKFDDEMDHNRFFCCDPCETDIPELKQLFDEYIQGSNSGYVYSYDIRSAYLDIDGLKMIPHVVKVQKYKLSLKDYVRGELEYDEGELIDEREVIINADTDGYELTDFCNNDGVKIEEYKYPICYLEMMIGTEKEKIEKAINERYNKEGEGYNYESDYEYAENESIMHTDVLFNGERCKLFMDYKVDVWTGAVKKMYCILVSVFFLILTLTAFLRCWVKNAKNKAQYAFEDYQRALTNNLAHDLKTPLAVIGGYAENLMEMRKDSGSEKELNYLGSIMKNVAYTDDIIAKTLELSETEQINKPNKKKVDIKALAEKLAEKYSTVLEEKSIDLTAEGGGEVNADSDMLSTAVENLISNAVKYTREGGSIKITADKKRLSVINDVAEDIDTNELLMPFVKGDKARSDKNSHGLGLAIAVAAAARNGFNLRVECKDKKFSAFIDF